MHWFINYHRAVFRPTDGESNVKQLQKIGICPNCDCSLFIYEDENNERYIKCEICGHAYNIPQKGEIYATKFYCPIYSYPIVAIKSNEKTQFFYSNKRCLECEEYDECIAMDQLGNTLNLQENV